MEAPGHTPDQLYVVRQTFRPNEPLREALGQLIATKSEGLRRFSLYGTDERVLEIDDTLGKPFDMQQRDADKHLYDQANKLLTIEGPVLARAFVAQGQGLIALRLSMPPQNPAEYESIREALDYLKLGREGRTPGFDGPAFYTTIAAEHLRPLPEVKRAIVDLNYYLGNVATRQLYQVKPEPHHVTKTVPRASRELVEVPKEEPDDAEYPEIRAS